MELLISRRTTWHIPINGAGGRSVEFRKGRRGGHGHQHTRVPLPLRSGAGMLAGERSPNVLNGQLRAFGRGRFYNLGQDSSTRYSSTDNSITQSSFKSTLKFVNCGERRVESCFTTKRTK